MTTAANPKQIFAKNLERARKRHGFSQEDLASDIGLKRQTIHRYEKGEISPSMDVVFKLAKKLDVTLDYFFEEKSAEDDFDVFFQIIDVTPFSNVQYREGEGLDFDTKNTIKKKTYHELIKLLAIENETKLKIEWKNPIEGLNVATRNDAEKAAIEVRKKWQLYNNPIANVINLLEGKGIRVFEIDAPLSFEGLSAKYGDLPIIVLNYNTEEVTRKRFTALHELGHLMLQIDTERVDKKTIEVICDAFAATMLMPRQLLILELGQQRSTLDNQEVLRLKEMYGISVQAILVGAAVSGVIDWNVYEKLNQTLDKKASSGYFIRERPSRFDQLWSFAKSEDLVDARTLERIKSGTLSREKSETLMMESL
jgi:Zn-dependent peptidase ImmA (M78 family)/DNA-binding XRE family transcriptional regulator